MTANEATPIRSMDLTDIIASSRDQDRGAWFDVLDPVTGQKTGIRFRVAGPDSPTQHRARLQLADDLADLADPWNGTVTAEDRERARLACLTNCILDWDITEDGEPVPFGFKACMRVLSAAHWLQAQVDGFAADRAVYRKAS